MAKDFDERRRHYQLKLRRWKVEMERRQRILEEHAEELSLQGLTVLTSRTNTVRGVTGRQRGGGPDGGQTVRQTARDASLARPAPLRPTLTSTTIRSSAMGSQFLSSWNTAGNATTSSSSSLASQLSVGSNGPISGAAPGSGRRSPNPSPTSPSPEEMLRRQQHATARLARQLNLGPEPPRPRFRFLLDPIELHALILQGARMTKGWLESQGRPKRHVSVVAEQLSGRLQHTELERKRSQHFRAADLLLKDAPPPQ